MSARLVDASTFSQQLTLASNGSEEAIGQLLDRYRAYLKLFARTRFNQLPGSLDASDIVQDAFLRAFRSFSQFRGSRESELAAWLRRILENSLIDYYRKHHLLNPHPQSISDALNESNAKWSARLIAVGLAPSEYAEQREALVLLAEALERLPEDYRDAVILRQLEELSTEEVARRMNRSAHSVRKLWARGMVQLSRELKSLS